MTSGYPLFPHIPRQGLPELPDSGDGDPVYCTTCSATIPQDDDADLMELYPWAWVKGWCLDCAMGEGDE